MEPDPISVAGVVDSAALPSNPNSAFFLPGTKVTASAAPTIDPREPEPV